MTPEEIKKELSQVLTELPVAALKEALKQYEVVRPMLLKALEEARIQGEGSPSVNQSRFAIHALYLLTQKQEAKAWPLVIELFSSMSAQDTPYSLMTASSVMAASVGDDFDEVVCDRLSQIFATLCPRKNPDDFRPLKSIIENTSIDEYVRDAALSALVVCYQQGDMELHDLKSYLHQLYNFILEQEKNQVWNAWVQACYNSEPNDFQSALKYLYEKELADAYYITLDELRERCDKKPEDIRQLVKRQEGDSYCYITDAISSLGSLSCYSGETNELLKGMESIVINQTQPVGQSGFDQNATLQSGGTDFSNIGRNDPCPCGSGKKFKKCCLH